MRGVPKFFKIVLVIAGGLVVLWAAMVVAVSVAGKSYLERRISQATGKAAVIDTVAISPPFTVIIHGLDVPGLLAIDSLKVSPDIPASFAGKPVLEDLVITRPRCIITGKRLDFAVKRSRASLPVIVRNLEIKKAEAVFIDHTVGTEGLAFLIKDLDVSINIPASDAKAQFSAEAKIFVADNPQPAVFSSSGTAGLARRTVSARLTLRGIDAMDLYPYFADRINLAEAGFQKLGFDFASAINGGGNDAAVQCRVAFTDVAFRQLAKGEKLSDAERIARTVFAALAEVEGGTPSVEFTVRTKLDAPRIDIGEAFSAALEEKIKGSIIIEKFKAENLGRLPVRLLGETLMGAVNVPKNILDKTRQTGDDVRGIVMDSIIKVKPKPQP